MNQNIAYRRLTAWSKRGRYVFTRSDLAKIFHEDSPRALKAGLDRLVAKGMLERPVRGVYVFALADQSSADTLEHIAKALRRGDYNYVSLESALSEYGAISQIPLDRLTVMTTGRKGEYQTPYGTIEFTHTKRQASDVVARMVDVDRPLRLATRQAAWSDLKRVGRNTHLVDKTEVSGG